MKEKRGKYQRLNQQSNLEIDNVRQDLASMRRDVTEDAERMIGDIEKERANVKFDKSKAEMRKQVNAEILSAKPKELGTVS